MTALPSGATTGAPRSRPGSVAAAPCGSGIVTLMAQGGVFLRSDPASHTPPPATAAAAAVHTKVLRFTPVAAAGSTGGNELAVSYPGLESVDLESADLGFADKGGCLCVPDSGASDSLPACSSCPE